KVLLNIKIIVLVIDLPFVIFLKKKFIKVEGAPITLLKRPIVFGLSLLILISYFSTIGQLTAITKQEFFTYHLVDIKDYLLKDELVEASEIYSQKDMDELKNRKDLKDGKLTGIGNGKNLLVIQVEALQNFVINFNYDG